MPRSVDAAATFDTATVDPATFDTATFNEVTNVKFLVTKQIFQGKIMRSLLLLFLGIPIPIIILIALFMH